MPVTTLSHCQQDEAKRATDAPTKSQVLVASATVVALQPAVARAIGGLAEAVILQQLHYWLSRASKHHAGKPWVYKTYAEWGHETGQSEHQARRALGRLRKRGLVHSIRNPQRRIDRTLWWTIDYNAVSTLFVESEGQAAAPGEVADRADGLADQPRDPAEAPQQYQRLLTETTSTDSKQAAATAAREASLEQGDKGDLLARERLHQFVDRRIQEGLGRIEYRDDDLRNAAWLEAFRSLDASSAEFHDGLDAAFARHDAAWRRRLNGPRGAQAFVGEFHMLRTPSHALPSFLSPQNGTFVTA